MTFRTLKWTLFVVGAAVLSGAGTLSVDAQETPSIKVMLLTGQMNRHHNWEVSHRILKRHLDAAGVFDVEVVTTPARGEDMSKFQPTWTDYDVVVLDYDGEHWPDATRKAFVDYMHGGGGLVSYHSTDNAFPDWEEYNEMIGLGGWGGRTEACGCKIRWRDGAMVRDESPGTATHPPRHDFLVTTRNADHPITRGMPEKWMHAYDELYSQLRGPAQNLDLLATGYAQEGIKNNTGENEPVLFTVRYGEGRIFHTTLGHVGTRDQEPLAQMNCVGFSTTLQRGTEWAGSGKVTVPVPEDFPTADATSVRN